MTGGDLSAVIDRLATVMNGSAARNADAPNQQPSLALTTTSITQLRQLQQRRDDGSPVLDLHNDQTVILDAKEHDEAVDGTGAPAPAGLDEWRAAAKDIVVPLLMQMAG